MFRVRLQRNWRTDSLSASLLASSHILHISPITWTSNQKGKKINLSLSPPTLHSVARATAAILPCPICFGHTSQAGHKCGMTVRVGEQRGWDGDTARKKGRQRDGEGDWPQRRDLQIISPGLWWNKKQDWPFWHNFTSTFHHLSYILIQCWSTCSSLIRTGYHLEMTKYFNVNCCLITRSVSSENTVQDEHNFDLNQGLSNLSELSDNAIFSAWKHVKKKLWVCLGQGHNIIRFYNPSLLLMFVEMQ